MQIDLSILICSIHTRYDTFLPKIQAELYGQYNALSEADQERVEILILTDNKKMMLGHKRNKLVELAQGNYVVFVDDDDRVAPDYIKTLLDGTQSGADSIAFNAEVTINGLRPGICHYSIDHKRDYNKGNDYYRIPNHICCVKRSLALKSSFPNVLYGEDSGYSKVLLPHLKTEHKIDRVLYYYDYNATTTETQAWRYNRTTPRQAKPIVDVIILSKANGSTDRAMTQKAVDSCYFGTNGLPVNIIVLENGYGAYRNAKTIPKKEAFNYNAFANFGAEQGSAEWIMVANNDLIFRDGWLHHLIAAGNDLVSPREPNDPRQADITENTKGYETGKHLSGWCFMIKRTLWDQMGGFDTDVNFWCSDDVVIEQARALGVTPMLVHDSIVEHIYSQTLRTLPQSQQDDMKWRNVYIFNKKYGKNKFATHPQYRAYVDRMKS